MAENIFLAISARNEAGSMFVVTKKKQKKTPASYEIQAGGKALSDSLVLMLNRGSGFKLKNKAGLFSSMYVETQKSKVQISIK